MRPPFLLDTCAALWFMDASLRKPAVEALTNAYNRGLDTFISPITAFEVGQLARKRRFKSHLTPLQWFERLLASPGMVLADLPPSVFIASSKLPDCPAKDPGDRIIAATAREYGFTVVTRDAALLDYGKQGYLSVLEC
jgi:PIN domain nuclease of toxin-antitoxin system